MGNGGTSTTIPVREWGEKYNYSCKGMGVKLFSDPVSE